LEHESTKARKGELDLVVIVAGLFSFFCGSGVMIDLPVGDFGCERFLGGVLDEGVAVPVGGGARAEEGDASGGDSVGRGRPRVLDAVKRAEVCAMLATGCTFRAAARYVGVSAAAIAMLLKRDESFRAQVDKALAERELTPLAQLRAASGKNWRAAAWLLERTVKGTYRKDNIADPTCISHAVDKEHQDVAMRHIANEEARTYLRAMWAGMDGEEEEIEAGRVRVED
jgi:hypothetical protein